MLVERCLLLFFCFFLLINYLSYLATFFHSSLITVPRYSFLFFESCFIKIIRSLSILFHLYSVCFLLALSLLLLSLSFLYNRLFNSPTYALSLSEPCSPIPRCLMVDKSSTKLKADYTFFLKREDEESENKTLSTFKGLLVLAPEEWKGYSSSFKGLPLPWKMDNVQEENTICLVGYGLLTRIGAFCITDLQPTSLVVCWWSVIKPEANTITLTM